MAEGRLRGGGLWKKMSQHGKEYLEGPFTNGTNLVIYENDYKKSENQPDYTYSFVEKPKEQRAASQGGRPYQARGPAQRSSPQAPTGPRLPPHKRPGYVDHTAKPYDEPPKDDTPWPDEPPF